MEITRLLLISDLDATSRPCRVLKTEQMPSPVDLLRLYSYELFLPTLGPLYLSFCFHE